LNTHPIVVWSVALAAAVAVASVPAQAAIEATPPPAVQVLPLGPVNPDAALGQSQYLVRYVIPSNVTLAVHRHEGTQIGFIVSGHLTYTVVSGAVPVYRSNPDGSSKQIDTVTTGQRRVLTPGQWVVETRDDVHYAANLTSEPVMLFTSTLLRKGAPLATPVTP
jgi:quercetin dioxygenase-like cupin family protein